MREAEDEAGRGDAAALQDELTSLPGVRAARVVATPSGRISEIHLVANGGKSAKQLVRDVQTVAMARFGLQVDYRVVSVVSLGDEPVDPPTSPLPELLSLSWTNDGPRTTCRVEVEVDGRALLGQSSGPALPESRARLAAQATAEAVRDARPLEVADVAFASLAGQDVAVVAALTSDRGLVVGTAVVRSDRSEAAVLAVLDAFRR